MKKAWYRAIVVKIRSASITTLANLFLFCFLLALLLSPFVNYKIGNFFFGQIPYAYNVRVAKLFFIRAAYLTPGHTPQFAHYQLSRVYFITGDLEQALYEVKEELNLYPENKRSYYILGLTLGYLHEEKEAIRAFSTFIDAYPASWAARNDKAWLQFRIGDIDDALKTIEPAAEKDKLNAWVQNTYCALLINKKSYEKAKEACTYAKETAKKMTEKDWGKSYPGNDPRIYGIGLDSMKKSIEENIALINSALTP